MNKTIHRTHTGRITYLYTMNKIALQLGLKRIGYAILLAFTGPFVIMQAFQNQNHPWYWQVLIVGLLLTAFSVINGFRGIASLVEGLLGKKKKK